MTQTVTISATAGPDLAAIINAALADPNVTTVILEPGLFLLHSSIIVPSGKTLMGSGREDTILRAAADFTWPSVQQNAVVVSESYSSNITLSDFSVDANRVSPDGLRLNGIMMRFTQDFLIERIDVSNATGYAHYAIGDLGAYFNGGPTGNPVSGRYEDLRTYNSQVHFEQYFADGITLFNIQARDGDGDISTEAYFHPIVGSRNVTYEQVSAIGAGCLGFSLIPLALPLENIYIIDSYIEIMRPSEGSALISLGALPVNGLFIDGSSFIAHNYIAFRIGGVTGTATNSYFQGGAFAIEVTTSGNGTPSQFVVTDSVALGVRDATSGFGVAGVHSDFASYLTWNGGSIEARAGVMFPISGAVTLSPTTQVIGTGHDVVATFTEDTPALTVFASANFGVTGAPDLNGATINVQYLSHFSGEDSLALLTQGLVSITGGDVYYDAVLVGTVTGGANGADLMITLNAAATPAIAEALLDSIAFSNPSDTPYTTARLFSAGLQIVGGGYFEITSSVRVVAVNDAPVVDLMGAGPAPAPVYVEEGIAIALTPDAVVSDVDSTTLASGTLTISIDGGYEDGDALQVTADMASPTGILVTGDVVSYFGTDFATISIDGDDGTLEIALGIGASLAAVQALIRAIEFSGTNDMPGAQARTVTFLLENGAVATTIQPTVQVTVNAVDDPAVAVADAGDTMESGNVLIDILSNDTDIDAFMDMVITVGGQAIAAGGSITLASGATVTLTLDGQLLYDPNGAFDYLADPASGTALTAATDSFTYGLSGGASAQVDIALTGETSAEDILRGDGNANMISASLAGQTLQGMAGADTLNDANLAALLQGGAGDDLYFIDNSGTTMLELSGEGTDTVRTTRTNLTLAAHVENLTYVGPSARFYGYGNSQNNIIDGGALGDFLTGYAGDDTLRGGAGNDVIDGGAGHDVLIGGTGGDAMIGGAGNDVYHIDSVNDQIIEGSNQGFDRISTTLTSYTIPNWVENLSFSGTAAYTGTGNAVGNEIAGSINGDTLLGFGGNDRLIGYGGNDVLNGGEGNDILQGGIGSDQLTGGTGADRFRFDTALSMTNIDIITDFEHGTDRIELSRAVFAALGLGALSATAFGQGSAAQNADQRIIYDETTGSLYYDADGDGAQAAVEFARIAPFTPLDAGDIFII